MPNIVNGLGQVKVGVKPTPPPPPSTLMSSIYSAYNADSQGLTSLKTSLFAAYNGESNANDSFGANNGTAMGGLTYTTGKIGNAFNLNGTTSYVDMGDVLDIGTSSWSYSMWFNVSTTNNSMLFSKVRNSSSAGRIWAGTNSNKIYFAFETTGGSIAIETTSNISTNTWYHITFVLDRNDKLKMYLNGTLTSVNVSIGTNNLIPYSSTNFNTNHPFRIGTFTDADNTTPIALFNGKIDAFNIWNRVLTASEITELYNSGNGSQYITDNFYKPTPNDALNTYNGTAQGGLTYGVGKVGTAFQFNGTNSYVQLGDIMDIGTSSWSYSMWFNANQLTAGTYLVLFSKSIAASGAGRVWATTYGNQLQFNFDAAGNANNINTQTTLTFNTNTWYHIVCVLDRNDKLKMYVNGTLVVLNTILGNNNLIPYSAVNYNTNNPFRIGAYTVADNTTPIALFNGQIDTFNVWNKVLTQSEITELYNSGNGKQYPF